MIWISCFFEWFGVSKVKNKWFWVSWTCQKSEKHENHDFAGLPKLKSKSYQSKMKQNNYTELLGDPLIKICSKNGSPDPKIRIVPVFSRIFL